MLLPRKSTSGCASTITCRRASAKWSPASPNLPSSSALFFPTASKSRPKPSRPAKRPASSASLPSSAEVADHHVAECRQVLGRLVDAAVHPLE